MLFRSGLGGPRLKQTIADLEQTFKVAQDNVWSGANIGVTASNHHLADLAHHPTPVGLVSAIIVQFFRVGTFVNKEGKWSFVPVKTDVKDLVKVWGPAVITGLLNWLVAIAEKTYEENTETEIPKAIKKLAHAVASVPLIFEIAKIADNWFGHLVSDMGGSKSTAGGGMGVPGIFMSLLYEVAALPGLKDTGLLRAIDEVYEKGRIDLREEKAIYNEIGKQAFPVILNEIITRELFFIWRFMDELEHNGIKNINWKNVIPFNNPVLEIGRAHV